MGTMANSEDPDEMQHNAAVHPGLHCLLSLKQPSGTEMHHYIEHSTCDPLKNTIGSPMLSYQYVWENPSEHKGLMKENLLHTPSHAVPVNKKNCYQECKGHTKIASKPKFYYEAGCGNSKN